MSISRSSISHLSFLLSLLFLFAGFLTGGCSKNTDGRQAISGTVTVDGTPVPAGSISFQPTEGQATSSGAMISNGKFNIPADDGLLAGKYRIAISAPMPGSEPANAQALPGDAPPLAKDMIPPDWNTSSKQFVEVKKTGSNTFPFEISTKAGAKSK